MPHCRGGLDGSPRPLLTLSLRIYTRTGDDGTTGLFGGRRVSKDDPRIEAVGVVDELNAHLGLAASACSLPALSGLIVKLQNDLFDLGADLATPLEEPQSRGSITISRMSPGRADALELEIDRLEEGLQPLRNFILPGGGELASRLHVCRSICRRAERRVVALSQTDATNPGVTRYLNRVSDLLFVMARAANALEGVEDVPWKPAQV
jgi:cob(I)alamin adenosyltransferase